MRSSTSERDVQLSDQTTVLADLIRTLKTSNSYGYGQYQLAIAHQRLVCWADAVGIVVAGEPSFSRGLEITADDFLCISGILRHVGDFKERLEGWNTMAVGCGQVPASFALHAQPNGASVMENTGADLQELVILVHSGIEDIYCMMHGDKKKVAFGNTTQMFLDSVALCKGEELDRLLKAVAVLPEIVSFSETASNAFATLQWLLQFKKDGIPTMMPLKANDPNFGLGKYPGSPGSLVKTAEPNADLVNMHDILTDEQCRPFMKDRLALALSVARFIQHLCSANRWHTLSSENVSFRRNNGAVDFEHPLVSGFKHGDWGEGKNKKECIDGLGTSLVEIAHWKLKERIEEWSQDLKSSSLIKLECGIREVCGDKYWEAVSLCFGISPHGHSGSIQPRDRDVDSSFEPDVLERIGEAVSLLGDIHI